MSTGKKLFCYEEESMKNALAAVRNGMAVATASKQFKVPRTSLRRQVAGITKENNRRVGPCPTLGDETEKKIAKWIIDMADRGFPINKEGLFYSVQKIVEELKLQTLFVNNTPGNKWFRAFMRRNPSISQKQSELLTRARAAVSESKIREWFRETKEYLGENIEVLNHPERVFNMDETAIFLSPKGTLILGPKGRSVYNIGPSEKDNVTTLITVNAKGTFGPPLTIFKFKRLPKAYHTTAPKGWGIGHSETGWMKSRQFYEYFANVLIPFLDESQIERPVVVFLDGHTSHLSLHLCNLCRANGIILICLPPNTTHMMQPLDKSFFFPLKQAWKKFCRKWILDHDGKPLQKIDIPAALNSILIEKKFTETIISGFRSCGIFPFDENAPNYSQCVKYHKLPDIDQPAEEGVADLPEHLTFVEGKIDSEVLKQFNATYTANSNWRGEERFMELYNFWKSLKLETDSPQSDEFHAENMENDSTSFTYDYSDLLVFDFPEFDAGNSTEEGGNDHKIQILQNILLNEGIDPTDSLNDSTSESLNFEAGKSLEPDVETDPTPSSQESLNTPPQSSVQLKKNMIETIEENNNQEKDLVEPTRLLKKRTVSDVLKDVYTWPENEEVSTQKKTKKYNLPSVITSDKWLELTNAKENQNTTKKKSSNKKEQKEQPEEEPNRSSDESEKDVPMPKLPAAGTSKHIGGVGTYVILRYDENYYPAKIVNIEDEQYYCCSMTKSGSKYWKWPKDNDLCWFDINDIVVEIQEPKKANTRGAFIVPEMRDFE